jgi:predicted alpha/beta superfamily hydrolase
LLDRSSDTGGWGAGFSGRARRGTGRLAPLDDDSPLAGTEVHYVDSEEVGGEFKVFVGHCGTDDSTDAAVLYLTDANGYFGMAVDIIRAMQIAQHLPPLLVVGIGYRLGALGETIPDRTRDLTPSVDHDYAKLFPDQSAMGAAPRLLAFIRLELMPWVAARYPVDENDSTYFGHSLGGLFGVYTLFTAPATFSRYAIGSPSLWWNKRDVFELEAAYAAAHDDLDARVFFGIGEWETQDGRVRESVNLPDGHRAKATAWYLDMVDDLRRLVESIASRGHRNLTMHSEIFSDEFHVTVAPLVLSRALRWLFDAPA